MFTVNDALNVTVQDVMNGTSTRFSMLNGFSPADSHVVYENACVMGAFEKIDYALCMNVPIDVVESAVHVLALDAQARAHGHSL